MGLQLDKITEEMFELVEKETGVTKEELLTVEENEDLRLKLLDILTWIEVDEIEAALDGPISKRGELVSDVITYICYKPPEPDDDEFEEEDD